LSNARLATGFPLNGKVIPNAALLGVKVGKMVGKNVGFVPKNPDNERTPLKSLKTMAGLHPEPKRLSMLQTLWLDGPRFVLQDGSIFAENPGQGGAEFFIFVLK